MSEIAATWADAPAPTEAALVLGAMDRLRVGLTVFAPNGVIRYANDHFRYLHRTFEKGVDVVGRRFPDLIKERVISCEFLGDGAPVTGEAWIRERARRIANNDWRPLELRLDDGRWIELKERPSDDGGSIGLWSDITELRLSHLRLEDAMSATADAFAYWSPHDELHSYNAAFRELTTSARPSAASRLGFWEWIALAEQSGDLDFLEGGPPSLPDVDAAVKKSFARHRDGRLFVIKQKRARDGGRVAVLTDVTEFGEAAAERRAVGPSPADRGAGAAERASGAAPDFLRAVAHELRTSLGSIIGFAEIIEAGLLGPVGEPQYQTHAKTICETSNRLLRFVNQALELAKVDAGERRLRLEAEDLPDLIADRVRAFARLAAARRVRLDMDLAEAPALAVCDAAALQSVLDNLISNAVHATGDGGAVTVSARADDDRIVIAVADTGVGLSPADLERVSRPMQHAAGARANGALGAGVGLALARALTELHGGQLIFKSKVGEGTTVNVALPAKAPVRAAS